MTGGPAVADGLAALKAVALGFPEAVEDSPWGECAMKVRGKVFVFLSAEGGGLRMTVKLPRSQEFALEYPFASPARHGLGKSGWVTATFATRDRLPMDVLTAWIGESFAAVAPKKLVAGMVGSGNAHHGN